ncbi:diaminopimelate decarboxylase [Clostridium homopropionicum DSM 5847]|uniref:Diaminopimelate decarboxylase n=1 Tax=Clostridium homopropionicum DSM 5847 TaxID=1121318 RepID=A0A0L6ZCV3_9CLOT|nr:diaminopimelate decarboxylase [Clostridium homopropionicum]KOA20800.1 diaminopimelate decarboxylase [Clostridium homopropionicum DSM 5847]SFF88845.1 diaminopimelate decarboxylase [Clostridium homopropionicum]
MKLFGTMQVIDNNLNIGGINTIELAKEFGTPLYVMDEELIRSNCKRYYNSFKVNQGINRVAYAGKAFLTIAMCQIINEEDLCLDVVSGGELYTAYKSEFPMDKIYFHGNNKTLEEIEMGIKLGVGRFVADNFYEIEKIDEIAKKHNRVQKILLRISPGIEAHTHDYIKTAQVDSKFGFTLLENQTLSAVERANMMENIELVGFHCHIGSQIFEIEPYREEVRVMLSLIKEVKDKLNYEIKELDLGGGFGIYYQEGDLPKETEDVCEAILEEAEKVAKELNLTLPALTIEPGRSIVGNAGTTLYTIGSIKQIPEVRKYVAVDGGMTDNIRPALYRAEYECVVANNVNAVGDKETVTVSGKCCESGDILLNDVEIPQAKSGDILAVLDTGAYGYSMSSNYNKIPRAAVVLVSSGKSKIICKRQSFEDLISNELGLY